MRWLIFLGTLLLGAAAAAGVILYMGLYDVSAARQHLRPTFWLLETALYESVKHHARNIEVPPLSEPALVQRGLAHYREHCVRCHGAPGVAPEPFALGLKPAPANLAYTARAWRPAELYWVVRYGIKMTGMPAWEYRLADEDLWAIVAFMLELPRLSPVQYRELSLVKHEHVQRGAISTGSAQRGKIAIENYACLTCHRIPGLVGSHAPVGPPLDGIGTRVYLSGGLKNTQENMVLWLRSPQQVNPASAMPDLGVSEGDAGDIAAYLSTLR